MSQSIPNGLYNRLKKYFGENSTVNKKYNYDALAKVEAVEDGDTWKGRRKPDPHTVIGPGHYRLVRVDTHETGGKHADKAKKEKKFTKQWIQKGRQDFDGEWPFYVVFADPDNEFEGTYGRALVDLVRRSDGRNLADDLLANFNGIRYKP